jgi:hypothetical protein
LNKKQVLGKANEVELSWAAASPSKDIEVAHQSSKDIEDGTAMARQWAAMVRQWYGNDGKAKKKIT